MSDTITLRDHDSEGAACVHGFRGSHVPDDGSFWCPGGREIKLKQEERVHHLTGVPKLHQRWISAWVEVSDG